MIELPFDEIQPGLHSLGVHRSELFSVLLDRCRGSSVDLREGHVIVRRHIGPDGVHCEDDASQLHGPFDFVVAADGSRSALRQSSGLKTWVKEYQHAAIWSVGIDRSVTDRLYQVVDGTGILVGLLPMGQDRCSFFWGLRETEWPLLKDQPIERWKEKVLETCPQAASSLECVESFEDATFATYRQVWMRRWFDPHTVFVGDAAHAMSPHLGQGVNFALMDAACLVRAVESCDSPEEAFQAYQATRRPMVHFYWRLTRFLTPFFQSDGWLLGWGRDRFLPWLPVVPWTRRQMVLTMAGLKQGWLKGR